MRATMLLMIGLTGCMALTGGKKFRIKDQTCPVGDYLDWHGGITFHVLQGSGDGTFDYDPAGDLERGLRGAYDLYSGDFEWEVAYAPAHWRTSTSVEGYGFAKMNGDLDVLYTVTDTDRHGNVWEKEVREARERCETTRRTTWENTAGALVAQWHEGVETKDGYDYSDEIEVGDFFERAEGTLARDETYTVHTEQTADDFAWEGDTVGEARDGHQRTDWVQQDLADDVTYEGFTEDFLDGSQRFSYSYDYEGDTISWDQTVSYEGDGTGSYEQGSFTCDLFFEAWECTAECSDGETYSCS